LQLSGAVARGGVGAAGAAGAYGILGAPVVTSAAVPRATWAERWQREWDRHCRRRWWRALLHECVAADIDWSEWEFEFLLALAEQDDIEVDQLRILSDLTTKVRACCSDSDLNGSLKVRRPAPCLRSLGTGL
jgi:hypothetical protein